jgi:hypothetical protein
MEQLQSIAWIGAVASTSERTAPQWQPPEYVRGAGEAGMRRL